MGDYNYDHNGAMLIDVGRSTIFERNHLNLPNSISVPDSNGMVMYYYTADGLLQRQEEIRDDGVVRIRDYIGGIEYINGVMDIVLHGYIGFDRGLTEEHLKLTGAETVNATYESMSTISERTIESPRMVDYKAEKFIVLTLEFEVSTGAVFIAEIDNFPIQSLDIRWFIRDHLGSVRTEFKDDGSGIAVVTSTQHYMPFGLSLEGTWTSQNQDTKNNYLKLGGERTRLFDLGYDLYAFRDYDPANPGWTAREPLSELFPEWGSFTANGQNPVSNIDPLGLDWYRHDGTGKVHWREGSDIIQGYTNIGANYVLEGENHFIIHEQNEVVGTIARKADESAIVSNRIEEGEDYTISTFLTSGNDPVSGYFLEPGGLYGLGTILPRMNKRIPLGKYNIEHYSSSNYPNHYRLYNDDVSKDRKILIHVGNYSENTEGCLLPGCSTSNGSVWKSEMKLSELRRYINSRDIEKVKLFINYKINRP